MAGTTDNGVATLLSRLAGQEMLGFRVTQGVAAEAVTKVGSVKVGSPKPPPVAPARQG